MRGTLGVLVEAKKRGQVEFVGPILDQLIVAGFRVSDTIKGLGQIDAYLAGLGLDTGWLVIFDRRLDAPPLAERLGAAPATTPGGRQVALIRA